MATREEAEARERFGQRYTRVAPVLADLEREVMGSDYGSNGYTPRSQADALADSLAMRPGERLLDVGSGCGWPGLYIASRSGCEVVVTDMPMPGMRRASARIDADALTGSAVVATARHLPFRSGSFDAVVHTDVLCCLGAKLSVLRACRRLLRDGGRTAFHVIGPAPNLTPMQRRQAGRSGPIYVMTRRDYPAMLRSAGFDDVEESDVTAEYRASLHALLDWSAGRERDLRAVLGDQLFKDREHDRRLQLGGIDGGLLRRSMIVARVAQR